jgi:hypothetical protein
MSRDDYIAIYKCIIKKKNNKQSIAYIAKWIQGVPNDFTEQEFIINSILGMRYTQDFAKILKIARNIDTTVYGSEYGIVLVQDYQNVIIEEKYINKLNLNCFFKDKDMFNAFIEPRINTKITYYNKYGFYSILNNPYVEINLFGESSLIN